VTLLEYLPIRRGSGGPQKPFSWLSEGVRAVFTINTETGEMTCIPHLPILGATPMSFVLLTVVLAMVMVALVLFLSYVLRRWETIP
jgi:hypothetical protein